MHTLINVVVFVAIIGLSLLVTQIFARWMYVTCRSCGTLNARRRTACRSCGAALPR